MDNLKVTNKQLNRLSVENFKSSEKTDIYIILDQLRSGNNIGSIFRTSDAFRIKKIYITGTSALPPNKEILKTALGSTETVDWEHAKNALDLMQNLKHLGVAIYAIEQVTGSISLQDFEWNGTNPIAIILGNEVEGVSQELINASDGCLEIPQFGMKHSLNVAVSSGIVLWHLLNQMLNRKN
ncbi:MAG: RNA methyltransferase [bacterium]|nr:RNA methyltransferase [bacterium]